MALQVVGEEEREWSLAVAADCEIADADGHHAGPALVQSPIKMARADAQPVESRRGRQWKPSRQIARGEVAVPKPFDSRSIWARLARRHESAEIDQRPDLIHGEPRAARSIDDCSLRRVTRFFSRGVI